MNVHAKDFNSDYADTNKTKQKYSKQMQKFASKYPITGKMLTSPEQLRYFNDFYSYEKKIIESSIRKSFNYVELKKNENLAYIIMALTTSCSGIKEDKLVADIERLKNRYSAKDMAIVVSFWQAFKTKYNIVGIDKSTVQEFYRILNIYGLKLLKEYSAYSNYFYSQTLLPLYRGNIEYVKTVKALTKDSQHSTKALGFFLQNISTDIEIAINEGANSGEVVTFFDGLIRKTLFSKYTSLDCHQKQGISILMSDTLSAKIEWMRNYPETFYKISKMINSQAGNLNTLKALTLYSYASITYSKMDSFTQKKMFNSIATLTDNSLLNLSIIYALANHTSYFEAIVNGNDMYKNEKYREILFVSRDGSTPLNYFTQGNIHKFAKEIDELVSTPYYQINDLTTNEKIDVAIKIAETVDNITDIALGVIDIASGGTTLPLHVAMKTLKYAAKRGARVLIKNSKKVIKEESKKLLKGDFSIVKKVLDKKKELEYVKYTKSKKVDDFINTGVNYTKKIKNIKHLSHLKIFYKEKYLPLCTNN